MRMHDVPQEQPMKRMSLKVFKRVFLLMALLFAPNPANAAVPEVTNGEALLVKNVNLIAMQDNTVLPGVDVLIENGFISAIEPTGTLSVSPAIVTIDGSDRYLMPGLVDLHTHLGAEAPIASSVMDQQVLVYLAKGVTTILNAGDFLPRQGKSLVDLAERVRQGELHGPTIYTAAYARGAADTGTDWQIVETYGDGVRHVKTAVETGYDFIKVYNQTPSEAFDGIIAEARTQGVKVIGHVPFPVGMNKALADGMVMVMHGDNFFSSHFAFRIDASRITSATNRMLAAGAWVNSTLFINETIADIWGGDFDAVQAFIDRPETRYAHPENILLWKRGAIGSRWNPAGSAPGGMDARFAFVKQYLKAFHDAGVRFTMGTDSPTVWGAPGFSAHEELRVLKTMGLTDFEVLEIATRNGGDFIAENLSDSEPFGRLAPGFRADMILLEANPLDDVANVDKQIGVIARGRWHSSEWLQAEIELIAASYDEFRDSVLSEVPYPDDETEAGGGAVGGGGGGAIAWLLLMVLFARHRFPSGRVR